MTAGQEAASELVATSELLHIKFLLLLEFNEGKFNLFPEGFVYSVAVMVSEGVCVPLCVLFCFFNPHFLCVALTFNVN